MRSGFARASGTIEGVTWNENFAALSPLNLCDMAEVKRDHWADAMATERWYRILASLAVERGCPPDAPFGGYVDSLAAADMLGEARAIIDTLGLDLMAGGDGRDG